MWKNLSKPVKVLMVLAAALGGIALLWQLFWLYVGGSIFGGFRFPPPPDFSSPALIASREATKKAMQYSLAELMSPPDPFTLYTIKPDQDDCFLQAVGKTGVAQRCEYGMSRIYGFDGDFRQKMIDLEDKILSFGWKTDSINKREVKYIMEEYYDKYYGKEPPPYNFPGGYFVSSLPKPAGWIRGREKIGLTYVERATAQSKDKWDETTMRVSPSLRDVLAKHEYALTMTIRGLYFRN
jgi:hypothetical protein